MRIIKEHDERKKEILDTSERLFIMQGYDKTTINDILKEIGIAKGTFYHYFKSKEEVMDAMITRIIDRDEEEAIAIAQQKDISALDRIIMILLAQSPKENETKEKMLNEFEHPNNALMQQRSLAQSVRRIAPILGEVVAEGNNEGVFHTSYPQEAIEFLIIGIQVLLDDTMFTWTPEELTKKIEAMLQVMERVLGAKKGSLDKLKEIL